MYCIHLDLIRELITEASRLKFTFEVIVTQAVLGFQRKLFAFAGFQACLSSLKTHFGYTHSSNIGVKSQLQCCSANAFSPSVVEMSQR